MFVRGLMIAMLLLAFTGFGLTTPDLPRNSETIEQVAPDVSCQIVNVVADYQFTLVDALDNHNQALNELPLVPNESSSLKQNIKPSNYALTKYSNKPMDGFSCKT